MGGYYLTILVRATDADEAKTVAECAIDDWFESGHLNIGDHGYVAENEPIVCGSDNPTAFVNALHEAQTMRGSKIPYYLSLIDHYMHECGITSLQEVRLEEESGGDMDMVGFYLKRLGNLIGRNFDPDCGFYNTDTYNGGLSPEEMVEIESEPEGWALITVVVG